MATTTMRCVGRAEHEHAHQAVDVPDRGADALPAAALGSLRDGGVADAVEPGELREQRRCGRRRRRPPCRSGGRPAHRTEPTPGPARTRSRCPPHRRDGRPPWSPRARRRRAGWRRWWRTRRCSLRFGDRRFRSRRGERSGDARAVPSVEPRGCGTETRYAERPAAGILRACSSDARPSWSSCRGAHRHGRGGPGRPAAAQRSGGDRQDPHRGGGDPGRPPSPGAGASTIPARRRSGRGGGCCAPVPEVGAAVTDALADVDGEPPTWRPPASRCVATTTEALLDAAEPDGLVVVLEDLHWADETSLRLLRHLAGELHRSRLLVIGTYRDPAGPAGDRLDEALPDLLRWPAHRVARAGAARPRTTSATSCRAATSGAASRSAHRAQRGQSAVPARGRPGAGDGHRRVADAELRHLVRTTLAALPPAGHRPARHRGSARRGGRRRSAGRGDRPLRRRTCRPTSTPRCTPASSPPCPTCPDGGASSTRSSATRSTPTCRRAGARSCTRRAAEGLRGARPGTTTPTAGVVAGHWLRAACGTSDAAPGGGLGAARGGGRHPVARLRRGRPVPRECARRGRSAPARSRRAGGAAARPGHRGVPGRPVRGEPGARGRPPPRPLAAVRSGRPARSLPHSWCTTSPLPELPAGQCCACASGRSRSRRCGPRGALPAALPARRRC